MSQATISTVAIQQSFPNSQWAQDLLPQELPAIKDAINFTLAVCQFDATPFKQHAEAYVAKYSGLEFTEEDVKGVTKIIAELNKKAKEFDDIRKGIKKEFNKPLNAFEEDINSVSQVYQNAVLVLKSKLEVYEQKYREEKIKQINLLIKEAAIEFKLNEKYALNIDITEKYLNKTETYSKIKKDLTARCQQQFTYQENERLAADAEAERLQRRITTLNELNANYAGRIPREVNYVDVARMTDDEVYTMFENMAVQHQAAIEALKAKARELKDEVQEATASEAIESPPTKIVDLQESIVHHRYICEITTTAKEDTILPWLKQMKAHGIVTFVYKKLEE